MPGTLGPSAEQAWSELRQHTEWVKGFWIAWLFTGHAALVHEYEERMQVLMKEQGASQIVLRPSTPEELRILLEEILSEQTRNAGCVWVEVLEAEMQGDSPGPWTEAWDWLMMRANERRGALSKHLSGGLIFAAAPAFKGRTAAAAPDLWSIRSLVLEPAPPAEPEHTMPLALFDTLLATLKPEASTYVPDVELALSQAERMHAQGHRDAEAAMRIRAAEGLLARGKFSDASEQAAKAVEAAGGREVVRHRALTILAMAEIETNDLATAVQHAGSLLENIKEWHDMEFTFHHAAIAISLLLYINTRILLAEKENHAESLVKETLTLAHSVYARVQPGTPVASLMDSSLAICHSAQGLMNLQREDMEGALTHKKQALTHVRRLDADTESNEPGLVRLALNAIAGLCRATGSVDEAREVEEMLASLPYSGESSSGK